MLRLLRILVCILVASPLAVAAQQAADAAQAPSSNSSSTLDNILSAPESKESGTAEVTASGEDQEPPKSPQQGAAVNTSLPETSTGQANEPATKLPKTKSSIVAKATGGAPSRDVTPVRSNNRMIEEIIVTAEKRSENIEDVPVAVSAFSASKLQAAGIQSTADLPMLTPGLTITGNAGFDLIYLRGIGTSAFIPSFDPSVATYVDGIYIPNQQGTLTDLGGVERVEILKGPQGTLFGRNSDGGAINVITKQPGDTPQLSISEEIGNYALSRTKLYASYPITSTLAINFSGIYSRENNYYHLVADPQSATAPPNYSFLPTTTKGGRVRLRWHPTEDLNFTVTGYRILQGGSTPFIEPNVAPNPLLGSLPGLAIHPAGPYETNANTPAISHSETSMVYGNASWSLPWLDIKALGSYDYQNAYGLTDDFDGGQPDIVTFTAPSEPSLLRTAELQFVSNDKGWTPSWLKWIGGVYWLQQRTGYDPFTAFVDTTGLAPTLPVLSPILSQLTNGGRIAGLGAYGILATHSVSAYLQTTINFTDWLGLTLGGRGQREGRFLNRSEFFTVIDGAQTGSIITYHEPKIDQESFSPKVSVQLRLIDRTLIYLSWSRGYKGGSYNVVTLYTAPQYVQPERNTSYEIGLKTTYFDGLQFNAAVFDNELHNLQETKLSLLSGGAITVENARAGHSRGVEFGAVWQPLYDADPDLVVDASATYLDAIYTSYPNASGFDSTTGLAFGGTGGFVGGGILPGRDFSGHRISRTPKASANLNLSQTFETSKGPLDIGGDLYYNSGFNFTAQGASDTAQPAYVLLNAHVSYLYQPWHVRATGYCKNLASRKYFDTSLVTDFGAANHYASPRTYGLILSYDY